MTKHKVADGQGQFHFDNLSAGEYYVVTYVVWEAPTQYGLSPQGCSLMQNVHLQAGAKEQIVMSGS